MSDKKSKWLNGNKIDEHLFCAEFVSEYPLVFKDGICYTHNGIWSEETLAKLISFWLLREGVTSSVAKKAKSLIELLRMIRCTEELDEKPDEINVQGGTIKPNGEKVPGSRFCRRRLNVAYNPDAPRPERWLRFLDELLEPADILTLQEYIGYCMIDSTKAQTMLFIIGNGGEGKSRIGTVMYRLFGESAFFASINELSEDKFMKYNLVGKSVLIDDDMNLEALRDTSFLKTLATAETPVTVQAKGRQPIQAMLTCRTMVFANGTPRSLYDRTKGWERRLMILSAKPVREGRVNDPYLAEKLAAELEGIFLWALEGLNRLTANDFRFTVSDGARDNLRRIKEDNCSIVGYLADEQMVEFGEGFEASTADLYSGYCYWCNLNTITPMRRDSFSQWIRQNAAEYHLLYSNNITIKSSKLKTARGFRGIRCVCGASLYGV